MNLDQAFDRRMDHLFVEAGRLAEEDAARIRAAASAAGSLLSGATLKSIVRAIEERAAAAALEALVGLDRRHMSSRHRAKLQEKLKDKIRRFLHGEVRDLAQPSQREPAVEREIGRLFDDLAQRLSALVDQHATGFTPAAPVTWVQAHPLWAFWIPNGIAGLALVASLIALLNGD